MSLFDKKEHLTRSQFRERLRKSSPNIPGSSRMFSRQERAKLEKEVFGRKYGQMIDKVEFKRKLRELRHKKFIAKTGTEKTNIDRKIRYLEKLSDIHI
ncbi:hypothetical protein KAU51_02200 [Candidatus Parcubacteria bacterium]|nr:hypothetical protein [Candidatus Parcubacteria bacterium]